MFQIKLPAGAGKEEVFKNVAEYLSSAGFIIAKTDDSRPWGGFFVLEETQIKKFKATYFDDVELSDDQMKQKLSPKFLLVAPGARLSWQYHFRRAELWKLISGKSGIVRSDTDEQSDLAYMKIGETVSLEKGERHRLVGLGNWGIVAEIWMHSDPFNPSDEEDIVRLADDYSR
jgi:mannose-6-phosphate isomerase-like protein (cupin superfamily)